MSNTNPLRSPALNQNVCLFFDRLVPWNNYIQNMPLHAI